MATHRSAEKKMTQDILRRERNRAHMGRLRTAIKKVKTLLEKKDLPAARKLMPEVITLIDRSVSKRILHQNTGSRYKSNLLKRLNAPGAGAKS
jgi:small subunit ribosomal protein S20